MTAAEKIINGILSEANAQAQEITDKAEAQAKEMLEKAREESEKAASQVIGQAQKRAELIRSTGRSSATLYIRDAALACRRREIDRVLELAVERINSFGDNEYFELLLKVAENSNTQGELTLSERDKNRSTAVFESELSKLGIRFAGCSADIDGGFILKCGDIEINAEIEAIINEHRSELCDSVNGILFD